MKVLTKLLLPEAPEELIPYPVLASGGCQLSLVSLSWELPSELSL